MQLLKLIKTRRLIINLSLIFSSCCLNGICKMYKKKQSNVKKFRKHFNTRIIRAKQTYSTEEIADLLNIHINTVHVWYKAGLSKTDNQKPCLVFGQDLKDFLNAKNESKKRPCAPNELFCCKCQTPRRPKANQVCIKSTPARTNLVGYCATCGTKINKAISPQKIDFFKQALTVQTVHTENLIECSNTCAISDKKEGSKHA